MNFINYIVAHMRWSYRTFGPPEHRGPTGPLEHLRKEVEELAEAPSDAEEAADVIILAIDVATRAGVIPQALMRALIDKQIKNSKRDWPDWKKADPLLPIEHIDPAEPGADETVRQEVDSADDKEARFREAADDKQERLLAARERRPLGDPSEE